MIERVLKVTDNRSFFLFGARGTGKSTFLQNHFSDKSVLWIDLLLPQEEHRFALRPQLLSELIKAKGNNLDWVIIDEIQKVPKLLNIVHSEIEKNKIRFALTGSSARKLKKGAENLLAGRAFVYHMFPFTVDELGDVFNIKSALEYGTLPGLYELDDNEDRNDFLRAYALTYLKEEVWNEQLVRNLDPFRAFLEVAAQTNGELVNYTGIARDVGVDTKTVQSYFQILEDTLLAYILEPYHSSVRKRQTQAPKFYFFDTGVCRALSRSLTVPVNPGTYGYGRTFEHFIITEIFRLNSYKKADFRLSYLRTKDGAEVDLIIERPGRSTLLVEIKSSERVDDVNLRHLRAFSKDIRDSKALCLSREPSRRIVNDVTILPWQEGVKEIFE